jgi:DNA-binding transcriptional ArsR family regulator
MPARNGEGIELLADPTRRAIVAQVALGRGRPSLVAKAIGRSRPATSRQLRLLRKAGLIKMHRDPSDGRKRWYLIDPVKLGQITAWLAGTDVGRKFPAEADGEMKGPSDSAA